MRIPVIRGVIDRRILVNFRVEAEVLARLLPPPFRPQTVRGYGMAGICLIRLKGIRPRWLPAVMGIASENAAHRIAVEWNEDGQTRCGVYIPRRDTSSRLNAAAGGRLFPGEHHRARFEVDEHDERYHVEMTSLDGSAHVLVEGDTAEALPEDSVFDSVAAASAFFEQGSLGYSPSGGAGRYDGLELRSRNWSVAPLAIRRVQSSFFDDRASFPAGSIALDNALLMRGIDHEWHGRDTLCCAAPS
ncbi:MAG: DUF2071 domain-containing protein [Pirellulaceae bacterium]